MRDEIQKADKDGSRGQKPEHFADVLHRGPLSQCCELKISMTIDACIVDGKATESGATVGRSAAMQLPLSNHAAVEVGRVGISRIRGYSRPPASSWTQLDVAVFITDN